MLVVLPKWRGEPADDNPRWIGSAEPVPVSAVEAIVNLIDPGARIVRGAAVETVGFGAQIALTAPQLIASTRLDPLVGDSRGMLVGSTVVDGLRVAVLSDPDVIANHGIGVGGNAAFALSLIDLLRPVGGTVVVDETVHGLTQRPDLWRVMFEMPFLLATLQGLVALCLLVWAGIGRFGPPQPPDRAFAPGAATLLDTGAGLLDPRRHGGHFLRGSADMCVRQVADRLHAPRGLDRRALVAWLDRVGQARRVPTAFERLDRDVATAAAGDNTARILDAAQRLNSWKREMLDGS
ncbi:MAG: hypothetical protein R3F55_09205 [Alphaproteobacteria bacterium]